MNEIYHSVFKNFMRNYFFVEINGIAIIKVWIIIITISYIIEKH